MDNKQKKMAFLGVLLLGCVATSWLQQGKEAKQAVPAPILNKQLASSTAKEKKEKTIQVYVSGAVREPGIYTLPAGSRTMSALERWRRGVIILTGCPSTPAFVPLANISSYALKKSGRSSGYPL